MVIHDEISKVPTSMSVTSYPASFTLTLYND